MTKEKYRELTKNTFLFSISAFGTKAIAFFLVPLYTFVLSTEEYGNVDILNNAIYLLVPLLTLNIQDAVLRFTLDKDFQPENVISSCVQIISISSCLLAIVLFVIKITELVSIKWNYWGYLVLSYPLAALLNSFSMYLRSRNKVAEVVVCGFLTGLFNLSLNLVFLLVLKLGVTGYLLASLFSSIFGVCYYLFAGQIYQEITIKVKKDILHAMICYSSPLAINSVAWWLNDASDRYILTFLCGAAANGVYAVAYKIPLVLTTLQGIFYNAWSVSAIKEFDEQDSDGFVGNIYSLYNSVSLIGCSILLLCNPFLARMLYAKDFFEAWHYVPALLVGAMFNGLALFEGCLYTAVKKTRSVTLTTITGAFVNTILNIAMIPYMGAYGAAIATLVGYLVVWITRTFFLNEFIKMKVAWSSHIICAILIIIQGILAMKWRTELIQFGILVILTVLQRDFLRKLLKKNSCNET